MVAKHSSSMRPAIYLLLFAMLLGTLLSCGCRRKSQTVSASGEFESAANKFSTAEASPAQPAEPGTPATPPPSQEMQGALQAYKVGQFEEAVIRLQKLRSTKGISGAQIMALNDAMATMMGDIQALAKKGDQRAIQAIKRYEKIQTEGIK